MGRRLQETWLAQPEPLLQFLADPRFQEKFEAKTAELTLASPWMTYTVRLAAADDQAMIAQYHEFSDGILRLNSMLNPGSRPPFARLVLTEAIANHRALPSEVAFLLSVRRQIAWRDADNPASAAPVDSARPRPTSTRWPRCSET